MKLLLMVFLALNLPGGALDDAFLDMEEVWQGNTKTCDGKQQTADFAELEKFKGFDIELDVQAEGQEGVIPAVVRFVLVLACVTGGIPITSLLLKTLILFISGALSKARRVDDGLAMMRGIASFLYSVLYGVTAYPATLGLSEAGRDFSAVLTFFFAIFALTCAVAEAINLYLVAVYGTSNRWTPRELKQTGAVIVVFSLTAVMLIWATSVGHSISVEWSSLGTYSAGWGVASAMSVWYLVLGSIATLFNLLAAYHYETDPTSRSTLEDLYGTDSEHMAEIDELLRTRFMASLVSNLNGVTMSFGIYAMDDQSDRSALLGLALTALYGGAAILNVLIAIQAIAKARSLVEKIRSYVRGVISQ